MTATTCTVRYATGMCGKPAVYTEGEFAECAACAAAPHGLAATRHMVGAAAGAARTAHYVGEEIMVHRYGKVYTAKVVRVGARGTAYAEFTYAKGTMRTVRVPYGKKEV